MSSCGCKKVSPNDSANIVDVVTDAYNKIARESADQGYADRVANAFGYSAEELQTVPSESHMGLSCGNPVATASIKEGETVIDLGSGGGIDVLLAAAKVGPTGQVIGLDNSEDMIARARRNGAAKGLKPPRVAFVKSVLTDDLPIESGSVDCILSNCVINLLPPAGKLKVMQEMHRVLKPGGRVSLDDIVAKKQFPDSLRSNIAAYVGCISGAILLQEYKSLMQEAGFTEILFTESPADLNVYGTVGCCGTGESSSLGDIGDLNEWAQSYKIYATKSNSSTSTNPKPKSALKNWWDAYPVPVSSPSSLGREEVADLIRNPQLGKKDFVVVDVRRDDHAGGHVRGSIQQPAQTFYDDLAKFYEEHKDTKKVIFYCGSSGGRGPRCAKWYQDYLDQQGITESAAFVLTGGVKEWLASYREQKDLVDFD